MAKASDLMGKSGSSGYQPNQSTKIDVTPTDKKLDDKHNASKQKPTRDSGPVKGGSNVGGGGAPTSVRPKV